MPFQQRFGSAEFGEHVVFGHRGSSLQKVCAR
jgi:hypothetical protein